MNREEFLRLINLATAAFSTKNSVEKLEKLQGFTSTLGMLLSSTFKDKISVDPQTLYNESKDLAKNSPRQFQNAMAQRLNALFKTSYLLVEVNPARTAATPTNEFAKNKEPEHPDDDDASENVDVLIVGGGPIGYAQALAFKKLNSDLKVVILEKYPEFRRKHTLVLQPKHLESYMRAAGLMEEPALVQLLENLRENHHIRTNVLQETLKTAATEYGVTTIVPEEVKSETIEDQLFSYHPKLIVGADGTHSVVNQTLFPINNQIKHEVDYALQLRYEISGDVDHNDHWDRTIAFYQKLARQGLVATEQIGRYDPDSGKTPVTVQLIISKTDFDKLNGIKATAKDPIKLARAKRDARRDEIPDALNSCITGYIRDRIKSLAEDNVTIDKDSISISVNELPALRVQKTYTLYNETDVTLNGDSALGLSYFKGLNAGLESLAKYLITLQPAIQQGLTNKSLLRENLAQYQTWFSTYADKKVDEVKQYSALRVRSFIKVAKVYRSIKLGLSQMEYAEDKTPLIDSYYKLLANASSDEKVIINDYPHRDYDPDIKLGQFEYVPILHSLKKIAKLFIDFVKPYKGTYQLTQDFKQPFVGLANTASGLVKLLVGLVTLDIYRLGDGLASLSRGIVELLTTPLAWFVKPVTRSVVTFFTAIFSALPRIEDNRGMRILVKHGEELLADQVDDDFSVDKMTRVLGVCNDLHRKLKKQSLRGQVTDINTQNEGNLLTEITSQEKPLKLQNVKDYFSLFGGKFSESKTEDVEVALAESPLKIAGNSV